MLNNDIEKNAELVRNNALFALEEYLKTPYNRDGLTPDVSCCLYLLQDAIRRTFLYSNGDKCRYVYEYICVVMYHLAKEDMI